MRREPPGRGWRAPGVRRFPHAGAEEFQLKGYQDLALNLHKCRVTRRCVEDLARQVGKYGIPGGASRVAGQPGARKLL